jgi:hypothetical protein
MLRLMQTLQRAITAAISRLHSSYRFSKRQKINFPLSYRCFQLLLRPLGRGSSGSHVVAAAAVVFFTKKLFQGVIFQGGSWSSSRCLRRIIELLLLLLLLLLLMVFHKLAERP